MPTRLAARLALLRRWTGRVAFRRVRALGGTRLAQRIVEASAIAAAAPRLRRRDPTQAVR